MLTANPKAFITSVCLRNTANWDSVDHFNADYIGLPDRDMLFKLFRVLVKYGGDNFMPLADYTIYGGLPPIKWPFEHLVPRPKLNKWLFALFFRLALPIERDTSDFMTLVHAPLNLTIFLRVLRRLEEVGYPKHWLSDALQNILTNNVVTTARPPRRPGETTKDIAKEPPLAKLSTAPFTAEMTTLCTLFQPLLPFRLDMQSLPTLESIRQYKVSFNDVFPLAPAATCLALVFYDAKLFYASKLTHELRSTLDSSWGEIDSDFKHKNHRKLREEGIAVWTTFQWDVVNNVASIYMPEGFVETIKDRDWECSLWRTDEYELVSRPLERARKSIRAEGRWVDSTTV